MKVRDDIVPLRKAIARYGMDRIEYASSSFYPTEPLRQPIKYASNHTYLAFITPDIKSLALWKPARGRGGAL